MGSTVESNDALSVWATGERLHMSRVSKKEDMFYGLLKEFSTKIVEVADTYKLLVTTWPEKNDELVKKLNAAEEECDGLAGNFFDELNTSFITPFDREDLTNLMSYMDETVDEIESVSFRYGLYDVEEMIPEAAEMATLTCGACHALDVLFDHFHDFKKDPVIMEQVKIVYDYERTGDDVYRDGLARLFRENTDGVFVLKWKSLLDKMEEALDQTKNVCKVVQGVVMKNA